MAETRTTQRFDLSDADVKEAIAEWVERKFGGGNPITVDVDARAITTGFGMNESTGYVVKVSATRKLGPREPVVFHPALLPFTGASTEQRQRIRDACPRCQTGDCENPNHQ